MIKSIPYSFNKMAPYKAPSNQIENLIWYMDFSNGFYQPYSEISGKLNTDQQYYQILTNDDLGTYLHCTSQGNGSLFWQGSKQYLTNYLTGTVPFSVSFWLRAPNWANYSSNGVLCWRNGTGAAFYNDGFTNPYTGQTCAGHLNCRNGDNNWCFTNTRPDVNSNWNHWVYTRDSNGAIWYYNGTIDREVTGLIYDYGYQVTPQEADVTPGRDLIIGNNQWTSNAVFDVTKMRIYNRAITFDQVNVLYKKLL